MTLKQQRLFVLLLMLATLIGGLLYASSFNRSGTSKLLLTGSSQFVLPASSNYITDQNGVIQTDQNGVRLTP